MRTFLVVSGITFWALLGCSIALVAIGAAAGRRSTPAETPADPIEVEVGKGIAAIERLLRTEADR
ncbi:hypothetical protein [Kitasatospora camelliae]|uniref:Lipoprotein n=1 Tax=Kitasatospora camelliae TaxID=3156397 RepID=A0AAU8K6Y1_9ACTN